MYSELIKKQGCLPCVSAKGSSVKNPHGRRVLSVESQGSSSSLLIIPLQGHLFLVILRNNPRNSYSLKLEQVVGFLTSCGVYLQSCQLTEVLPEELERLAGCNCQDQCNEDALLFDIMKGLRDIPLE